MNNEKEYDYDFSTDVTSGDITPHRVTAFLPYTFHRLNRILEDYYGCKLEEVWQGYKANRKPGYKQLYNIVTIDEGRVICSNLTLDQMRSIFAQMDYPLYDEKSAKTTE